MPPPSLLEFPPHAEQRPHRSPAARSAHLHKTKFADDASGPFSVKTIAAHHPDLKLSPDIGRGKNAAMPKRKNHGTRLDPRRSSLFKRNRHTQRGTDQPDGQKSSPSDQPKQKSLPQSVWPTLSRCLTRDRRRS